MAKLFRALPSKHSSRLGLSLVGLLSLASRTLACGGTVAEAPTQEGAASAGETAGPHLEQVPATEAADTAVIAQTIAAGIKKEFYAEPADRRLARRDAHAKHHGCVRASFEVNSELPPSLTSTVFRAGAVYDAWIRYSNGNGKHQPDAEGDGRGMALKLVGVPGDKILEGADRAAVTQDFLMINHPTFFVRNVADYVEFTKAVAETGSPRRFFLPGVNFFNWRITEAKIGRAIQAKRVANPLHTRYFSMTPYLFGDKAVKFSAKPCRAYEEPSELPSSPDFLREAMAQSLRDGSACFEFLVQTQADARAMPVEDPTQEWSERDAPFVKVATLTIPRQAFEDPAQMTYCENLAFTPWHSVPEHRPLGGINRARRTVYETISSLRRELNGVVQGEPTDLSVPGATQ
jgi:hypothetical protein